MKNCVHCGAELEKGAFYCSKCGHKTAPLAHQTPENENYATAPITLPTVLGLVSLASGNLYASLIMSIIGVILGAKERKATGKKLGLILNIVSLSLSGLGFLSVVVYLVIYFLFVFAAIILSLL